MGKTRKINAVHMPPVSMATGTENNVHVGLTCYLLTSLCFHVSWHNVVNTDRTGGLNKENNILFNLLIHAPVFPPQ